MKYIDADLKAKSWQNPTISACLVILVNIIVQLLKDEGNSLQRQIPPHPDYFQYTTQSRDSKEITNPTSGENREKLLCENIQGHCTIDDLGKKKDSSSDTRGYALMLIHYCTFDQMLCLNAFCSEINQPL